MSWNLIGSITVGPTDYDVPIGPISVPDGGVEVRVVQTSPASRWTYSYGLLTAKNATGRFAGTIKVYGHPEGETYLFGDGLSPLQRDGFLYFTPRLWNLRWLQVSNERWSLSFYIEKAVRLPAFSPVDAVVLSALARSVGARSVGASSVGARSVEARSARFGDFSVAVSMSDDGNPPSTKSLKAWVEGNLKTAPLSSAITKVTPITKAVGFAAVTYMGNGTTQNISGLGFSPDLVWIKARSTNSDHKWTDTLRGATNYLESNNDGGEASQVGSVTDFKSDGFTLGNGSAYNKDNVTYVAWTWNAGDSTVTNTDGSITSSVRANASTGFSIVTYTGNDTAGATIGHGLGVTPEFVVIKRRDTTGNWIVYHKGMTSAEYYMYLNSTAAETNQNGLSDTWDVSSTTITLKAYHQDYNSNPGTYVAYCFAPVAGFSDFGTFTGGSAVSCGFQPKFVLAKRTDASGNWEIVDDKRGTNALVPNTADLDASATIVTGLTATGFTTAGAGTYIYAAFTDEISTAELELTDLTGLADFIVGDAVTEVGNGDDATGTVLSVDTTAKTITLSSSSGTWDVGSKVKGPLKTVSNVRLYALLDAAGAITDLQSADPGFVQMNGSSPYTLSFPSSFPTGNTPDQDLPPGTELTVELEARNDAGAIQSTSNTLTP